MRRHVLSLSLPCLLACVPPGCATENAGNVPSATPTASQAPAAPPARPAIAYAEQQITAALATAGSKARVRVTVADSTAAASRLAAAGVTLDTKPESFAAFSTDGETLVIGRDDAGAVYGAMEIAERLENGGAAALPLAAPITASPAVPVRGANLFLVLPAHNEPNFWFRQESFWREYLDMLARARINYLDLHGMYNLDNTRCPNAFPYFASSRSFPEVGVPKAERDANLNMLNRVIEMAGERGMRVGLMTYRTGTGLLVDKEHGEKDLPEASLEIYTREAVRDLAEHAPGLWRLGFRIGESGRRAPWFIGTFVKGLEAAGGSQLLSTRTWLSSKVEIMQLIDSTRRDTMVEAKYNGEQAGPPYQVAGGLMAAEQIQDLSYSYEDYLDPPSPNTFVFHIWTGGTDRIFRYASYERIRRTVPTTLMGGARGFSMMAPHTFYPQYEFYHKDPHDRFSPWSFRRDELEYLMFGRLGYDMTTPDRPFRKALERRTGTDALWEPLQAASDIVPWIHTAHTCGADHRYSAPEMEWNGSVGYWASPSDSPDNKRVCDTRYHGPYDIFSVASPFDAAADLVAGHATSRLSPIEVAHILLDDARRARAASSVTIDAGNAEARDVVHEAVALADLGEYAAHKLLGSTALAVYSRTGRADYLAEAKSETALADKAWEALVAHTAYINVIDERLRMVGRLHFKGGYHWSMQKLDEDPTSIEEAVQRARKARLKAPAGLPAARAFLDATRAAGPGLVKLTPTSQGHGRFHVTATLASPPPAGAHVRVLYKALSSLKDWQSADATGSGTTFDADVALPNDAGLFAVEIEGAPGAGWRYPDVLRETPYVVVNPKR